MPRRERPKKTTRSEHWMRVAANEASSYLNARLREEFGWCADEDIRWLSPIAGDEYAEYYDSEFLERLGVDIDNLSTPLGTFWPKSGPRWDGLAKTGAEKIILVEAKAYVEEGVDFRSGASARSLAVINESLEEAKRAFGASELSSWASPFYQYANRLAHLCFLAGKNQLDAFLVFIYFANAPDVPNPCSTEQWEGAQRLTEKCLGLGRHPFRGRVGTIIIDVDDLLTHTDQSQLP